MSDGADDIRISAFGFELLLDIRNEEVARFRDSSSEVDRFLAYLLVKRGAYKITRNPEDTADGDEEKRGVGEEDFVVEFDGLTVLCSRSCMKTLRVTRKRRLAVAPY